MKIDIFIMYSLIIGQLLFGSQLYSQSAEGIYPIKNFGPEDYQAGIQNIDFAQNRTMDLFVANNLGVLAFNGNKWTTYAYRNGKKQRSLAFDDTTNKLYVGSQGEFGYFDKNWEYNSLLNLVPSSYRDFDEVWDVFLLDENVYFCTFRAIFRFDGNSISVISNDEGFNRSFSTGNRLFTQNSAGKLLEIKNSEISQGLNQVKTDQIVSGLISINEGFLIFYNSGEIELSNTLKVVSKYPELIKTLNGKYVNHVFQMSDTRLAISTQRGGLYLFNMQTGEIVNINSSNGLKSNACLRSFQDNSGNLWVGMQNGLALIDINSPIRLVGKEINIQGSGYEAFQLDEGTYYTTSNGIFYLPQGADQCNFLPGTEGPAYGMQMINSKLYAGHHTGLFLLSKGNATKLVSTDGLWRVKQLLSNPEYAIGGSYSGLILFKIDDNGLLERVEKIKGFSESSRFFEEDFDGNIWVGQFYKGLFKIILSNDFKKIDVQKITKNNIPIEEYIVLTKIDDQLHLATKSGVYKIDRNTNEISKSELFDSELDNSWVYLLTEDKNRNVHIFSENNVGFYRQISTGNYVYIPSSLFQLRHSFNNDLLHVSTNIKDGVYFNSNEGFIYYNPSKENLITIEKKPVVNKIYSVEEDSVFYARLPFEEVAENSTEVKFKEVKDLKFIVESFKFKNVDNQKFRYFLEGFDVTYSEWTFSSSKEYTNLPAGNYLFFVQTLNSLGQITTSESVRIVVEPPFLKTKWMKAIYGMVFLFLGFLFYRFQRYRYKGKENKLKIDKQAEIDQKQKELQHLKEEKIESELRHVNNLLAASTMNLVVKNEFMENIKQELHEVRKSGAKPATQKSLEKIIKEIDTTLRLQEDWKQFEHHFDKVHGDFLTRLTTEFTDLTPGEQKLSAFLRLNMDTKEVANLLGISLRGVEVARYRLRKKLGLENYQNLSKFILEY